MHVNPNEHVGIYLQFHDNHALGLPLNKVQPNMRDVFDLRQGYVDLAARSVRIRAGRQELRFGSERVIGISDWTNNSRTFDGFSARLGGKSHFDVFTTSVVVIHPTSLDKHGSALTFHGLYGTLPDVIPHTNLQPYVLFKALPSVVGSDLVRGSQLEVTAGAELEGKLPASLNYQLNGALQRGTFADDKIRAGAFFGKLGFTADKIPWTPHITGEFAYASGNDPSVPGHHSTFDQQYPSNHNVFGLVDLFGYQNTRQERLHLELKPTDALNVLLQAEALHLASRQDSLYSGPGGVLAAVPRGGFASNSIGKEFDASMRYSFPRGLLLQSGVGYFKSGAVFSQTKLNGSDLLGYLSLTYVFTVSR
jgi:hypothetical protein